MAALYPTDWDRRVLLEMASADPHGRGKGQLAPKACLKTHQPRASALPVTSEEGLKSSAGAVESHRGGLRELDRLDYIAEDCDGSACPEL